MSNDDRPVYLRLRDTHRGHHPRRPRRRRRPVAVGAFSLAAEHGANPLTVAKAYQTFQDEGLIVVKRGVGMFVAPGATQKLRDSERKEFLEQRWPGIAAQIRRLDLDVEDLVERALA